MNYDPQTHDHRCLSEYYPKGFDWEEEMTLEYLIDALQKTLENAYADGMQVEDTSFKWHRNDGYMDIDGSFPYTEEEIEAIRIREEERQQWRKEYLLKELEKLEKSEGKKGE